jgi:hypothetical protein
LLLSVLPTPNKVPQIGIRCKSAGQSPEIGSFRGCLIGHAPRKTHTHPRKRTQAHTFMHAPTHTHTSRVYLSHTRTHGAHRNTWTTRVSLPRAYACARGPITLRLHMYSSHVRTRVCVDRSVCVNAHVHKGRLYALTFVQRDGPVPCTHTCTHVHTCTHT